MEIFIIWVICSGLVGLIGIPKKLGFWGIFFISLLLSPFIGLIVAIFNGSKRTSKAPEYLRLIREGDRAFARDAFLESEVFYKDAIFELSNPIAKIDKAVQASRKRKILELERKLELVKEKI